MTLARATWDQDGVDKRCMCVHGSRDSTLSSTQQAQHGQQAQQAQPCMLSKAREQQSMCDRGACLASHVHNTFRKLGKGIQLGWPHGWTLRNILSFEGIRDFAMSKQQQSPKNPLHSHLWMQFKACKTHAHSQSQEKCRCPTSKCSSEMVSSLRLGQLAASVKRA